MTKVEAIAKLREVLKPGDTCYTIVRHVARSGMSRRISVFLSSDDGPWNIDYLVAAACDYRIHKDGGLKVSGCGMDMGFAVVYDLSRTLWPNGVECIGEKCLSNDHSNGMPRHISEANRDPRSAYDGTFSAEGIPQFIHSDGGYALRQRWM